MGAIKDTFAKVVDTSADLKILEVGVGRGDYMSTLIDCFSDKAKFVGIDPVEDYLNMAQEKFKNENVTLHVMDGENIDIESHSFDIVTISNTLHHLSNPEAVLQEMKRLVKTNGYIAIHEMVRDQLTDKQEVHAWTHHLAADIDCLLGVYHGHTMTRDQLNNLVLSQGFDLVTETEYKLGDEISFGSEKEILDNTFSHYEKQLSKLDNQPQLKLQVDKIKEDIRLNKDKMYKTGIEMATECFKILKVSS